MAKDQELEKRLSNFFEMFRTEGWKQLLTDLAENAETLNSVEAARDEQDLYFRKGQLATIATMLNFESVIEIQQKMLEEDEE